MDTIPAACWRSEPEVVPKVPFMVDSSKWEVIERRNEVPERQGGYRPNSIFAKEGEVSYPPERRAVRKYGCSGGSDGLREQGQAADLEEKIRKLCERRPTGSWSMRSIFRQRRHIFDQNILTVPTGPMEEHKQTKRQFGLHQTPHAGSSQPGGMEG